MKTVFSLSLGAALALAGCADTEPAHEAQQRADSIESDPVPARVVQPVPTQTASDDGVLGSDRVAQGSWTSKTERGVPMALFGEPQTEADFTVRCEDDTLVFARSALLPEAEAEMRVMAGGNTRQLVASTQEGPVPQVTARLPASDAFAGTLARTTDPIAVSVGDGGETYPMPSSPELRGVVTECIAG